MELMNGGEGGVVRVAAIGDVHCSQACRGALQPILTQVAASADILALCGDLTNHGLPDEAHTLVHELSSLGSIPVVAVLGNHDHEAGAVKDLLRMLESAGVRCLDRGSCVIDGVGFAGAKGFGGGFGDRIVKGFGEDSLKAFVSESVIEAEGLRAALRGLDAERKVALLHYSPTRDTILGEPAEIHPFLGTTRLSQAVDEGGAVVAIHGHAHRGSLYGKTDGGVPVWNVSLPVLRAAGKEPALVIDV
jgi:Icc-related predicted phosphoesterase